MAQRAIPAVFMRGGTSRGPYFHAADLPTDVATRDAVLLRVMGSPDTRQIDGIGGATTLTSKVAIVSTSEHPSADIDYTFAQVDIERRVVDWDPTCGNMLSGVGPFAIEEGLIEASHPTTPLVVRNVNTGSLIDVVVQTPNGAVTYDGACAIDGVPGTGAPIELRFREIMGSKTGKLLPTGNVVDEFDGVAATCLDVAMPLVIVSATDLGMSGYEAAIELTNDAALMTRIERLRQLAGTAMGLGAVAEKVVPKFAVVSPAQNGAHFASRYFTPSQCHAAYAVSGSICAAASAVIPGTVTHDLVAHDDRLPSEVEIEHPSGAISVGLSTRTIGNEIEIVSGGAVRTARRIMDGHVFVPEHLWP